MLNKTLSVVLTGLLLSTASISSLAAQTVDFGTATFVSGTLVPPGPLPLPTLPNTGIGENIIVDIAGGFDFSIPLNPILSSAVPGTWTLFIEALSGELADINLSNGAFTYSATNIFLNGIGGGIDEYINGGGPGSATWTFDATVATPEPSTYVILAGGLALAGLAAANRRKVSV